MSERAYSGLSKRYLGEIRERLGSDQRQLAADRHVRSMGTPKELTAAVERLTELLEINQLIEQELTTVKAELGLDASADG